MNIRQQLFFIFCIALFGSALLCGTGRNTLGEIPLSAGVPFKFKTYWDGSWQKYVEQRRDRDFGLRNTIVRLNNIIYDWFNLGLFHYSYNKNILQGKGGVIFEKGYMFSQFNWSYEKSAPWNIAETNVKSIKILSDRLGDLGVKTIFVLFPNKVTQQINEWPILWKLQQDRHPGKVDYYALYEQKATSLGVDVCNLQKPFIARRELNKIWFPETGTHWSLAMAGRAAVDFSEEMNHYGYNFPIPLLKRFDKTNIALHAETDIWDLLNYPSYKDREKLKHVFYIPEFENCGQDGVSMFLYGDSFNENWERALMISGVSNPSLSRQVHNRLLTHQDVFQLIENHSIFSVGYTLGNLSSNRIRTEMNHIVKLLDFPLLDEGWWQEGENFWSSGRASVKFAASAEGEMKFSFRLIDFMPDVSKLKMTINGTELPFIGATQLKKGEVIQVLLPKSALVRGVNKLDLEVSRAGMPAIYGINGDTRVLGIRLSEPRISSVKEKLVTTP